MKLADTSYAAGLHSRIPHLRLCAALLLCLVLYGCTPFAGPVSTPTPGARPIPAGQAILGGTEAAFTRQYGPPSIQDVYHFVPPTEGVVTIALGMRRIFSGQLTGQLRVQLIYLRPDREWTPHEAEAVYRAFLPEDSVTLGEHAPGRGDTVPISQRVTSRHTHAKCPARRIWED